ncbi:hypothetical protein [Chitinophaga sp.]|uniref:DUF6934 family protein n=1 Tax=Chitinophaga sp. TaxID=1869181 RepID=UPI0031E3114E
MQKEKYPYKADDSLAKFEFQSHGPNGIINKTIVYSEIGKLKDGTPVLNLGFGDLNETDNTFSDISVSNNADREKVLATVASSVLDIMSHYDDVAIRAVGSTPARTRLYQMGINAIKKEIESQFNIYGFKDDEWHKIESCKNYNAFLLTKKNSKFE